MEVEENGSMNLNANIWLRHAPPQFGEEAKKKLRFGRGRRGLPAPEAIRELPSASTHFLRRKQCFLPRKLGIISGMVTQKGIAKYSAHTCQC